MRSVAVKRMRHVGQPAHLMDQVHRVFRMKIWRQATADEEADDLTFSSFRLFADDGEVRLDAGQLQRALDGVVICQRDALEPELATAVDQIRERALPVVRV